MANIRLISVVHFLLAICLATTVLVFGQEAPQPLSDEEFKKVLHSGDTLDWLKIVVMTDKQAKKIVECGGPFWNELAPGEPKWTELREVWLNGLATLTKKQAKIISGFTGYSVRLNGIDTLTDGAIKALIGLSPISDRDDIRDGKSIWRLLPDSIRPKFHKSFSMRLFLDGLSNITDKQAEYLSEMEISHLSLKGLSALSDAQVEAFGRAKADYMFLDGVAALTDAQLKTLAQSDCIFGLRGLGRDGRTEFKSYGGKLVKRSERP